MHENITLEAAKTYLSQAIGTSPPRPDAHSSRTRPAQNRASQIRPPQIRPPQNRPLNEVLGCIVARDYHASFDLPPASNAAVDGYAVHASYLARHPRHKFRIIGTARAGHPFTGQIRAGEALRIFTGALVPPGPDVILMHEDTEACDTMLLCQRVLSAGVNIRPAGENLKTGEVLVKAGHRLTPALIGQLAAAGHAEVTITPPPLISIMSTGDELLSPPQPAMPGKPPKIHAHKIYAPKIYDSNRPMLCALLQQLGMPVIDAGIIPDQLADLVRAYEVGLAHADIIISSGGASDSLEDHTQAALRQIGADILFWRLAIKPGRPFSVARFGKKFIFCLPGNPVASFVCFKLLVQPALMQLSGGHWQEPSSLFLPSGFTHKKRAGRAEYLRAVLDKTIPHQPRLQLYGRRGAGVLSSVTGADGLVEIPLDTTHIREGDMLKFLWFKEQGL